MGVCERGVWAEDPACSKTEAKGNLNTVQELYTSQGDQSQSARRWGTRCSPGTCCEKGVGLRAGAVGIYWVPTIYFQKARKKRKKEKKSEFRFYSFEFQNV